MENYQKEAIFNGEDFETYLEELINSGRLETVEEGICKHARTKGYGSLSPKQKFVFDKMMDDYYVGSCQVCGDSISWHEMLDTVDNGGTCPHCQYVWQKIEDE